MKIILIDSNSLINRAFHALPLLTTKDGAFTNGVLGYTMMLQRLIAEEKPTHICAVFDCHAKTFRHKMYDAYKGTRKPMPEELVGQIPLMKEVLTAMGVSIKFLEGFEADDIVGTLAKRFNYPTIIVSGDRDCLQLVDDTTTVYNTRRGVTDVIRYTPSRLAEDGFTPKQIIEYKGLAGDSSDNIPGASGVGDKTAKDLLNQYGDIDNIYAHIGEIKGKLQERLIESKEKVYLSEKLATIDTNVDIPCTLDEIAFSYPLPLQARSVFQKLEFNNITNRFEYAGDDKGEMQSSVKNGIKVISEKVESTSGLEEIVNAIPQGSKVCIEWGEKITLAVGEKSYSVIVSEDLFGTGLSESDVAEILGRLYTSDYKNIFFDAKTQMHYLASLGIKLSRPYEDVLLKAYLINCNKVIKDAGQLLSDYGYENKNTPSEILSLDDELDKILQEKDLVKLYYDLELPLEECLFGMENVGFRLDMSVLHELDEAYTKELDSLVAEIHSIAGENFNVNSNKQLGDILFNKLGLKGGKKNKTGFEVSADVLEKLDHPIIECLLRYRQLAKLKSTYIDGMLHVMNKKTNRVHTTFKQCLTATGRLSSTEPNLQNIPVKTALGREIRRMFLPSEGNVLVSADYSQIELRLLAHFSEEPHLIDAYKNGEDIHTLTASKIFRTPMDKVTHDMRSNAKAVNFGIIYGISSFGLANNTNVSRFRAKEFIDEYFATYPKVKEYMESNVELANKDGYLRTMLGRIRYFPELKSSQRNIRAFGERAAMNMPLQGSASDIIKVAMLRTDRALKEKGLKAKLILQVHDELIIDTPSEETEAVKELLLDAMQNAVELRVPLTANVSVGKNWYEAK